MFATILRLAGKERLALALDAEEAIEKLTAALNALRSIASHDDHRPTD